jgi:hypothetical protein
MTFRNAARFPVNVRSAPPLVAAIAWNKSAVRCGTKREILKRSILGSSPITESVHTSLLFIKPVIFHPQTVVGPVVKNALWHAGRRAKEGWGIGRVIAELGRVIIAGKRLGGHFGK